MNRKTMKKLLVFSILLVGCNRPITQDPRDIHGINQAFTPYVNEFEYYLGRSIGEMPVQFGPQTGNIVGECIVWNDEWREIKIDQDYWDNGTKDDDERMSLIFHELGHCILDRGHLNTQWNDNGVDVYVSFMNAYLFFNAQYPEPKAYYINELFHPAPGYPTLNHTQNEEVHYTDSIFDLNH